jgi:hypothetical protein
MNPTPQNETIPHHQDETHFVGERYHFTAPPGRSSP